MQTPQCPPGLRLTLRRGKARQAAPTRREGQAGAWQPGSPAVQRLPRGVAGATARGQPGTCARAEGGGGEAPRASRWARPSARVRAPRFLPHVPRTSRPLPAGSAHLPPSRGVSLGLSEPHIPRSCCQGRRLRRGSSPAAPPKLLGAAPRTDSPSSAAPCPFPALLSHPVHRESLVTKHAGLRKGLEKWRCRAWIMPSTAPPAPVKR